MRRIVVAGGSRAGHQATQALRGLAYEGKLTVVGGRAASALRAIPATRLFGQTATVLDVVGRQVLLEEAALTASAG